MTEPRRSSRVSPQTQAYNPAAIAEAQRKREIELGAKVREPWTPERKAAKRARLEARQRAMAENQKTSNEIQEQLQPGDGICYLENGDAFTFNAVHDEWGVRLSRVHAYGSSGISVDVAKFGRLLFGVPLPQDHALAFAMASHVRLGKASVFAGLVPDLVQRIAQAAYSEAVLFKVDTTPTPIPINLVFAGDSAVEIVLDESPSTKMKRAIDKTLDGWRFKSSFKDGFGSISPSRVCWEEICGLASSQITASHSLGPGNESMRKMLLDIHLSCTPVQLPAQIMLAYARACHRGDPQFEIAYRNVWTCRHYAPCIGGDNRVLLAGGTHKLVRDVGVGDVVSVAGGEETALVIATWRSQVGRRIPMVSVHGVRLTPDHPVWQNHAWVLPSSLSPPQDLLVDAVFNFRLSSGHSLMLQAEGGGGGGGEERQVHVQCCTLGMDVPGMPDPLWGTDQIFKAMQTVSGYPRIVTAY